MGKSDRKKGGNTVLQSSAAGAFTGYILTMALLYVLALLICAGTLEEALADELVLCAAFLGATAAAVISAKRRGRGVMTTGLAAGAFFCLMAMVTSFGVSGGTGTGIMVLKLMICSVAGGAFGGALCLNTKRNKRLHH